MCHITKLSGTWLCYGPLVIHRLSLLTLSPPAFSTAASSSTPPTAAPSPLPASPHDQQQQQHNSIYIIIFAIQPCLLTGSSSEQSVVLETLPPPRCRAQRPHQVQAARSGQTTKERAPIASKKHLPIRACAAGLPWSQPNAPAIITVMARSEKTR